VGKGRVEEFAGHGWDMSQMIDPQDPEAYRSAILQWDELGEPEHVEMLDLYRHLIALRSAEPELTDSDLTRVRVDVDESRRWLVMHRGGLRVIANLADESRTVPVDAFDLLLATGTIEVADGAVTLGAQSAAIVRAR
jgi:maltooligosyltrehalose trehalohydrolase